MLGNETSYKELLSVLNLVDYWYELNNKADSFYIYSHSPVCSLTEPHAVQVLYALSEIFPQYLEIEEAVDFYQIVGPGYIVTPPMPGDDRPIPFAKVKIVGSIENFRTEMNESDPSRPVTTLEGKDIKYDTKTSMLHVGNRAVAFEHGSKQADVLGVVCSKNVYQPTELDEIHEIVTGGDDYSPAAAKSITDCANLINKTIYKKLNTKDKFLTNKNKTVFRNY